jgi:hypothetical protein
LLAKQNQTDRLKLWEKKVDGFTFSSRDEFLREKVLIDYDLTEKQFSTLISALKDGKSGGIEDLVVSVEPAGSHGGVREGAGRPSAADLAASVEPAKGHGNQVTNGDMNTKRAKRSNHNPERIIARLKRDKDDDALAPETREKAKSLLSDIEKGEVKPYGAAKAMGWVKPPDPAAIVEKQREKLEPQDQVRLWQEWGRALPEESVDRVQIAREAILNLTVDEQRELLIWANETLTE